jgi:hypothetical protein
MVLSLSVKLLKANGQPPSKNAKVAVANNFLNCLFKSSTILLNNTPGRIYQSVRTKRFGIYTQYRKSIYEPLAQTKLTIEKFLKRILQDNFKFTDNIFCQIGR